MKLYENVAIGNFLYGLGFAVGKRVKGDGFPSIVNLLQQTPDDTLIGDLLIQAPGILRIFEFKQRDNNDNKEPKRHAKLSETLKGNSSLIPVSRTVHWFVETAPDGEEFFTRIVPYLDAYPRTSDKHDFAAFVNSTADAVVGGAEQLTTEDMSSYLAQLLLLQDAGDVGSGGLVVNMSETGNIQYAELTSILDLKLTKKTFLKQHAQIQSEQERDMNIEKDRTKGNVYGR